MYGMILSCILFISFPSADAWALGEVIPNPTSLGGSIDSVFNNIVSTDSGLVEEPNILNVAAKVIKWLLSLSAVLAMGALVWGGIMYIMSLGDEGRAGKAKQIIWYAIIGVIVVLISYVIIATIQTLLSAPKGTAAPVLGIAMAYAEEKGEGFLGGIKVIKDVIDPGKSGLAMETDVKPIILRIVGWLLGLVAVLALAALVWGSISYVISLGDEGKTEKAKKIILYAIVGVLLTGVSFVILRAVQGIIAG